MVVMKNWDPLLLRDGQYKNLRLVEINLRVWTGVGHGE